MRLCVFVCVNVCLPCVFVLPLHKSLFLIHSNESNENEIEMKRIVNFPFPNDCTHKKSSAFVYLLSFNFEFLWAVCPLTDSSKQNNEKKSIGKQFSHR